MYLLINDEWVISVGVSLEWLEATSKRAVTWSDWKSAIKEEAQKRTLEGVTNGTI